MTFFIVNMFFAFLAAISPGPNIILTIQNTAIYGKKTGFMTAAGILIGVILWFFVLVLGLNFIFQNQTLLLYFHIFAFCYLLFIAYSIAKISINEKTTQENNKKNFFLQSFIMTILNSEIAIFYASILSGIFSKIHNITFQTMAVYILGFICVETIVFLTTVFAISSVRKFILRYLKIIKFFACIAILYYAFILLEKILI